MALTMRSGRVFADGGLVQPLNILTKLVGKEDHYPKHDVHVSLGMTRELAGDEDRIHLSGDHFRARLLNAL